MTMLGVNVDHVATIRQARGTPYPDPVIAAAHAVAGGADQITVHLREDRRHIQERDVERMLSTIGVPLNLEMAAVPAIADIACLLKPHTATIVPERRAELTTEGGLTVVGNSALAPIIERLTNAGIIVSLFLDPDTRQIEAARELGVHTVELHTGVYCDAPDGDRRLRELERLAKAARTAHEAGLKVAAGHGLNYDNVTRVRKAIELVEEYNIGHAIIARALFDGMERAVRAMKELVA